MPVQNIECQIAQAQITRLLAGDSFTNDVLGALESHIALCPDCRRHVSNRRSALEAMVSDREPEVPPTRGSRSPDVNLLQAQFKPGRDIDDDKPEPQQPIKNVVRPSRKAAVQVTREPSTVQNFWKPLGYSCALAAVLFAMSYVMKNPTAIFGDKAVDAFAPKGSDTGTATPTQKSPNDMKQTPKVASTTPPEAASKSTPTLGAATNTQQPGPSPAVESPKSTQEPKPSILANADSPAAQPIARIRRAAPTPPPHRARARQRIRPRHSPVAVRHRVKPTRARSSLRIYDSDGDPIN